MNDGCVSRASNINCTVVQANVFHYSLKTRNQIPGECDPGKSLVLRTPSIPIDDDDGGRLVTCLSL